MTRITIIQHNVRCWLNYKHALTNIYLNTDPDIILINEHHLPDHERPKIINYNTYSSNKNNFSYGGVAIAIKKTLKYKIHDDFDTDMLAITLQTEQGPLTIGTSYVPPSTGYLNTTDFYKLFHRPHPTYFLGDLNGRHPLFGY